MSARMIKRRIKSVFYSIKLILSFLPGLTLIFLSTSLFFIDDISLDWWITLIIVFSGCSLGLMLLAFGKMITRITHSKQNHATLRHREKSSMKLKPENNPFEENYSFLNIELMISHEPLALGEIFTVRLGGEAVDIIGKRKAILSLHCLESTELSAT